MTTTGGAATPLLLLGMIEPVVLLPGDEAEETSPELEPELWGSR
ncbi:hypothetical protein ACFTZM_13500 [Streptomyces hydrogenans]